MALCKCHSFPEQQKHLSNNSRRIAFCPHCGNTAPQRIVYSHTYHTDWYDSDGNRDEAGPECQAILCICETCNEVLLYDGVSPLESGDWPTLAYPRDPQLPSSVPSTVRRVYEEASRIKNLAPNAFAVMIRRAIEEICDERGTTKASLAKRLDELAQRGDIPPTLAELTDVLRLLGNAGAHASDTPVTMPMVWAMDDFFRVVVEYVYVAPSKLADFRSKLSKAASVVHDRS